MPYITSDRRNQFEIPIDEIVTLLGWDVIKEEFDETKVAGDLNYIIYSIIKRYIEKLGPKYNRYNMLLGVLDCCSKEIYRKLVAPYEEKCIEKNGDI